MATYWRQLPASSRRNEGPGRQFVCTSKARGRVVTCGPSSPASLRSVARSRASTLEVDHHHHLRKEKETGA
ncbi:hypothetical protein VPH35_086612 [Triticum aestivum]